MKVSFLLLALAAGASAKDCGTILPEQAIHWAEYSATSTWGPYLANTPKKMDQAACIAACEANVDCKGWAYRYGDPKHIHYEKCFLLDASHTKYAPKDAKGHMNSGLCADVPKKCNCDPVKHQSVGTRCTVKQGTTLNRKTGKDQLHHFLEVSHKNMVAAAHNKRPLYNCKHVGPFHAPVAGSSMCTCCECHPDGNHIGTTPAPKAKDVEGYPKCMPHKGSVHAMCNGVSVKKWGIGPEGAAQAVKNCHYAAQIAKRFAKCLTKADCKFGYYLDGNTCTKAETDEQYARTLDGHRIHLRAANGKFLVAEDTGAANANREKAGSWETWTLEYQGGKKVGFKGAHNKYLVAEAGGQANANRPVLSTWETFEVDKVGEHSITLLGEHGKYLGVEESGALKANLAKAQKFKVYEKGTACNSGHYRNENGNCKPFAGRCKWGTLIKQGDRTMNDHCGECNFGFYLEGGACHAAKTSVDYARAMDDTRIHLRAANGKYVTAMSDGKADANGKKPSSWQTLTLEWLGGTRVGFKSIHGKYFVAEAGGPVNANRPNLSSWETFDMEHFGNHKVTLKGDHGKYLVVNEEGHFEQETTAQKFKIFEKGQACPAGQMRLGNGSCQQRAGTCRNGELAAPHDRVRENWCGSCDFLYYLVDGECKPANTNEQVARSLNDERIHLKSAHGKFLVAEDTGAANANRAKASSWETFTFIWRGGDKVAFKSVHGKYLVAEPNGQAHANRPVLSSWETFTINHYGNGKVSLKGDHGKWLVAESTGELMANREKVGSFEKFKVMLKN